MSRNATASWSGYSHQGKIGLLVALCKIHSLGRNNLSEYSIEYETMEDVVLKHNDNPIEVHQVKAFMTSPTIGSYTSALMAFQACTGGNFLHTIAAITNWDELTATQNPSNVERYSYSNGNLHCGLDEISAIIDREIESVLNGIPHPESGNAPWRSEAYSNYLFELDNKIRHEHLNNTGVGYNVRFTLEEVLSIVAQQQRRAKSNLVSIREKLYQSFVEFLKDAENATTISDAQVTTVTECIEKVYKYNDADFEQFLRNINPHTTGNVAFESTGATDSYFVQSNFLEVFVHTILSTTGSSAVIHEKTSPHFFKEKHYLLTSINIPRAPEHSKWRHAYQILTNDRVDFSPYESDFVINESLDGELGISASLIKNSDPSKFINPKKLEFIPKENAITKLNE